MAVNGYPDPVMYTDEVKTLFLVTLPCHPDGLVTKPVTKLKEKDIVDIFEKKSIGIDQINKILYGDISDVREYVIKRLKPDQVTKSVTKSLTKILGLIDFFGDSKDKRRNIMLFEDNLIRYNDQSNSDLLNIASTPTLLLPPSPKLLLTSSLERLLKE